MSQNIDKIEVFELGSHVLVDGEIPAVITGINLRPAEGGIRLSYEVTWWDERSRKSDWVEPYEIKPQGAKHKTLSFVPVT